MSRSQLARYVFVITFLGASLVAASAFAASGYLHGRMMFYNNQGNYCPDWRDCTGAKYPESEANTNMPVADSKIFLYARPNGELIGQAIIDTNGYYTLRWENSSATSGYLEWHMIHKDGRFSIRSTGGGIYTVHSPDISLQSGTTTSAPQQLPTYYVGSSTSPHALANLYDGAWRMWYDALSHTNRMWAYFDNVEIRAFDNSCPTSCARGAQNRIIIDSSGSAYKPQARVMHEMGHISSYEASHHQKFKYGGDYNWPSTGTGGGWNLTSAEWGAAQFEEGLATFLGDGALYQPNASEPYTCNSSGVCSSFNLEASSGAGGTCATNENRYPISVDRYLRDLYDSTGDTGINEHYYVFVDTLNDFPGGIHNGDKDEPFCDATWPWQDDYLCDRDGRSARDFRGYFEAKTGLNTASEWVWNCSPVGD